MRGLPCAYFIDGKGGVVEVETLPATAILASWLGRHESFCSVSSISGSGHVDVFSKRPWHIRVGFARIASWADETESLELGPITGQFP